MIQQGIRPCFFNLPFLVLYFNADITKHAFSQLNRKARMETLEPEVMGQVTYCLMIPLQHIFTGACIYSVQYI